MSPDCRYLAHNRPIFCQDIDTSAFTGANSMTDFPRFDLNGQIALVTGAARGLGRSIALALAHAGADVALGLRDVQTGSSLVKEIEAMGRRALPLQMDITRLNEIQQAVDAAVAHFGRIDILVNNAGLG